MGCFPKTEFNNPEMFTRRLIELFTEYPEPIVADVARELPLKVKYLYISDVAASLELRSKTSSFANHWDRVVAETLARR